MSAAMRRAGWVTVAAAIVLAGAWYLFAPTPIAVEQATAEAGPIEVTITEEGKTRVRDVYRISAPIAGKLERLELHEGDNVSKAQRVASIRPVDPPIRDLRSRMELAAATRAAQAAVAVAEAQVKQADSALRFARNDLDRQSQLVRQRVISERAMEQAQLDVRLKEAELRQAQSSLELRRQELDSARARELDPIQLSGQVAEDQCCVAVTSPASGTVLKVITESEQVTQAGSAILEVGDPNNLEVVVELLSADAVGIAPGTRARIEDWGGEGMLDAVVRRVDPAGFTKVSALGIEEQRVNVILDITSPGDRWKKLGHQFKVLVRLIRSQADNVLQVPLGALFRKGGQWAVYIVQDGHAAIREITLGRFAQSSVEVTGGLKQGDVVIVYPNDQVSDGVAVALRALPG